MIEAGKKRLEGDYDPIAGIDTIEEQTAIFLQIDSYKNTESVKEMLINLGYAVSDAFNLDLEAINKITQKLNLFIVLAILCIFIIEIILFRNSKIENENNYNLLYVVGYRKRYILTIYVFSNLIQIIISLIISAIILLAVFGIIQGILSIHPFIFSKYRICFNYTSPIIVIGITLLSAMINYFSINKKVNGDIHETETNNI